MSALESASTRPYLIRALHEWCSDNAFTPYIAVRVDETVQVPREYVQGDEIVLNVSFDATSALKLGNEYIEFKARFGGVPREIMVPVDRVLAIYARENGQGMAFPVLSAAQAPEPPAADAPAEAPARPAGVQLVPVSSDTAGEDSQADAPPQPAPSSASKRPALKRVK